MVRHRTQGRVRRQIQDVLMGNAKGIAGLLDARQVDLAIQAQGVRFREAVGICGRRGGFAFRQQSRRARSSTRHRPVLQGPARVCPKLWWHNWPKTQANNCIAASQQASFWAIAITPLTGQSPHCCGGAWIVCFVSISAAESTSAPAVGWGKRIT